MILRCGLRHELSYAFVKRAVEYQIGTGAKGGANTLVLERGPFSENCGNVKFDLNVSFVHPYRFTSGYLQPFVTCNYSALLLRH